MACRGCYYRYCGNDICYGNDIGILVQIMDHGSRLLFFA